MLEDDAQLDERSRLEMADRDIEADRRQGNSQIDTLSNLEMTTTSIWVPYIIRIQTSQVLVSRLAEKVPLLNRLGAILLATAVKGVASYRVSSYWRGRTWLR